MPRRFAHFDGLRGIAVLAVITYHVATLARPGGSGVVDEAAIVLGGEAVIVFFVVSGFLLYRPFVAARAAGRPVPDLRRFGRRRILRIVPAYWVALTVLAVFPGIVGVFTGDFWRYYGFLQLYDRETIGRGIPVAWTLCVEVTYYLALPLWVLAARRWTLRQDAVALGVAALAGAVLQVGAARHLWPQLLADALPGQMTWLALGMALAVWSVGAASREPAWIARRPGVAWAVAGAALVGLVAVAPAGGLAGLVAALGTPRPLSEAVAKVVLSAVLAAALLLPAVFGEGAGGLPRRILGFAPVAFLGTVSYSLYLYHLTLAELVALPADPAHFSADGLGLLDRVAGADGVVLLLATLAITVPIAAASFRWIEAPCMRRGERRPVRPGERAGTAAAAPRVPERPAPGPSGRG